MASGRESGSNLDIVCLSLFVLTFAGFLLYDEISEALLPIIRIVICCDVTTGCHI